MANQPNQPNPPKGPPPGPAPTHPPPSAPRPGAPSALARQDPNAAVQIGERGIILRSFDELMRFAEMAVKSGTVPRDMTAGGAAIAIQAGLERGLGPLGGLQQCTVINNQLSWKGQAAFALIQNSPLCKPGTLKAWVEGEGDDRKGVCVGWRVGYAEPSRTEFSYREAKLAGLTGKDNWKKYPDRQLKWRAVGYFGKDYFSDVLGGFPIAEEAADYDDRPPSRAIVSASGPPKAAPSGPDPVLEELEKKAAEAVVEAEVVEVAGEELPAAGDVLEDPNAVRLTPEPDSTPVRIIPDAPAPEPPPPEDSEVPPSSALRSKLGLKAETPVPPAPCCCHHAGHFEGGGKHVWGLLVERLHEVKTDDGTFKICGACVREKCLPPKGEPAAPNEAPVPDDEQPTPPRGVPIVEQSDRAAHLAADRELAQKGAKQERLFTDGRKA